MLLFCCNRFPLPYGPEKLRLAKELSLSETLQLSLVSHNHQPPYPKTTFSRSSSLLSEYRPQSLLPSSITPRRLQLAPYLSLSPYPHTVLYIQQLPASAPFHPFTLCRQNESLLERRNCLLCNRAPFEYSRMLRYFTTASFR